jgi:hypothetical protein
MSGTLTEVGDRELRLRRTGSLTSKRSISEVSLGEGETDDLTLSRVLTEIPKRFSEV